MCDKIDETIADLKAKGVKVTMYEPKHPIAAGMN